MSEPIVEISNLSLQRRGSVVLDSISLTLQRGDFVGIIGPNGGGKTSLLQVMLGLLKPTQGSIRILGSSPEKARGRIGYVPQYARFDHDFPISALDVVLMGRLKRGCKLGSYSAEDISIAHASLNQVGMGEHHEQQIGKLSGGQIQRVLVARALAVQPELLLLDEPTASVDTPMGRSIYHVLEELSQKLSIVLVSHDIGVISAYVRTIACLNRKLHYHHSKELSSDVLEEVYGCPVELIAHGHAHRVLADHEHDHAHGHAHEHGHEKEVKK